VCSSDLSRNRRGLMRSHAGRVRATTLGRPRGTSATPAGFALAPRGRPRVVARTRPAWLRISPRRLRLAPHETGTVLVTATRAEPGDHPALLLLRTQPLVRGGVAVRMQIGVLVVLRAPGRIVHDLHPTRVRARAHTLQIAIVNRGNVTEELARLPVVLSRRGRVVARLRLRPRELLPHGSGIVEVPLPRRLRGAVTVAVLGRMLRVRL